MYSCLCYTNRVKWSVLCCYNKQMSFGRSDRSQYLFLGGIVPPLTICDVKELLGSADHPCHTIRYLFHLGQAIAEFSNIPDAGTALDTLKDLTVRNAPKAFAKSKARITVQVYIRRVNTRRICTGIQNIAQCSPLAVASGDHNIAWKSDPW